MNLPVVLLSCPINGILNYIPQHRFHRGVIYIQDVCVAGDEQLYLEGAQVEKLWRRSLKTLPVSGFASLMGVCLRMPEAIVKET